MEVARLADALRRADAASNPPLVSDFDAQVVRGMTAEFRAARARLFRVRLASGGAIAAGLALAVYVGSIALRPPAPQPPVHLAQVPDTSGTILEAFELARLLRDRAQSGPAIDPVRWDATGDGLVNAADVDALAQRAVELGRARSFTLAPPTGGGDA